MVKGQILEFLKDLYDYAGFKMTQPPLLSPSG